MLPGYSQLYTAGQACPKEHAMAATSHLVATCAPYALANNHVLN